MATTLQFVDSIASSPTVRLDINADPWMVTLDRLNLSPPPMQRASASTLLNDGATIKASAYENRILSMHLELVHTSQDNAATEMQKLARELNRPTNILKYQPGTTAPVFFKTYRSPDFTWTIANDSGTPYMYADVEIVAEPFAYGLQETPVSLQTLNTNPAGGGNDCYFDVTSVKGDVETPAYIRWPGLGATTADTLFAVKRRGTPSAAPFLIQAEAMTQGTNTTTQANDANFSGAGNNWSRCTFTTATEQSRISTLDLGTASVDLRGRYRVFMRYRKSTSTDDVIVHLRWGDTTGFFQVDNDDITLPDTTSICMVDLGEIDIPGGADPTYGPDGVELSVSDAFFLSVRAERTAGTGNLDFDFLLLVPADDRMGFVYIDDSTGVSYWSLYAEDNAIYGRDSSNRVVSAPSIPLSGGFPMLTPNQTNRIYILYRVGSAQAYSLTTVANVSISYWPRYLSFRPATT